MFQNNVCPGIPCRYTENVMSSMELRPSLFPSSVCLGSNGFDSHIILYLSKLRLQTQCSLSRYVQIYSNTKDKFKSFLYEGQRTQFLLKINCQHCLFLVLLCMTYRNLDLGDNLFLPEFLVTKKKPFLDYIILEKMKQGLGRIIT